MLRANSVREESGEDYVHSICSEKGFYCTVCLGSRNIFFCIFNFYATSGVQSKGMIESSLLSK